MGREIERRFFVKDGFHPESISGVKTLVHQTYLLDTGSWAVRGRKYHFDGVSRKYDLTLKQKIDGLESKEIIVPTTQSGYDDFASECLYPIVKDRYYIPHFGLTFEVDIFLNTLSQGLILAEIELPDKRTTFDLPDWLGEEITGRKGMSNFAMWRKMHGIKKK